MQDRAPQKNLIGPLQIGFGERARVALRLCYDLLELASSPRRDIDGDLARITWLVRVDGQEPLLESIRLGRLSEGGLGQARTRDKEPRDREP